MPDTPKFKLVNELHIAGKVATDPQQVGKGPLRFRLAHGGGGKRQDGTPWPTQFFTVNWWQPQFSLSKGDRVEVFGKLKDSNWLAPDGTKRNAVEITADSITQSEDAQPASGTAAAKAILAPPDEEEPF